MIAGRVLPKYLGRGAHRVVPPKDTLGRIAPLLSRVGVTRVADITRLDRLGIPVYSAIVPDSRDVLSVYNGKGTSRPAARVGAVMEAIERHCALNLQRSTMRGAFRELSAKHHVIHPRRMILRLHPAWTETTTVDWVEGVDLLSGKRSWVPAQAAGILYEAPPGETVFAVSTTNGLAAGNEPEEAICHALCELVERDAWTLAELEARYRPQAQRRREAKGPARVDDDGAHWVDDRDAFPDIDLSGARSHVLRLAERFTRAGLRLLVKDITSDLRIPTVVATAFEGEDTDSPLAHFGLGTHPDAEVAIVRALTEVAQSRAVDIQGVREDISAAREAGDRFAAHAKRVERVRKTSWYYLKSSRTRVVRELPSIECSTIGGDVEWMLSRLRGAGVRHVVAVDLTRSELGIPVFRVLAPGLESWAADHGRLGWRAAARWEQWFGPPAASEGAR